MKIYTKRGDKGQTSLFGGLTVQKNNCRVMAYGDLDELNSHLGFVLCQIKDDSRLTAVATWILSTQKELFALGSWLASPEACERVLRGEPAFGGERNSRTQLSQESIEALEKQIDQWENSLPPMDSFILPGGSMAGSSLHIARTICRRAERSTVAMKNEGEAVPDVAIAYLNRLADALFVLARFTNQLQNQAEVKWS